MKKLNLQRIFFSVCSLLMLMAFLFSNSSCTKEPPAEIVPGEALMAEFSQSPPIVREVFSEKLEKVDNEGNTVLLTVTFAEEETRIRGINSIPLTIDEKNTLTLNDRGIGGDKKENDGVFSIALKVSDEELTALVSNNNEVLRKQKNRITTFNGRIEIVREIKETNLDLRERFPLEHFFLSSVSSTTLPDIRNKSLMITDLSVVEDLTRTYDPCRTPNKGTANGAWSFKTLITNMSNGLTAEQFLINWVDNFLFSPHSLPSTDASDNRSLSKEKLIKAWMFNSGVAVADVPGIPVGWQTGLRAEDFPVRLLAIVNRLDLRGNQGYGGFSNGGEGRFVFGFVDSRADCNNGGNGAGTMTFILEYGIPISSCTGLRNYAQKWWDLQSVAFGAAFNTQLEDITKEFTDANANPSRPNGSALNHLRTNDFLQGPWDIRDFEIDSAAHTLKIIHPNRESMESSNGFATVPVNPAKLAALVTFVNSLPFTAANPNPPYGIGDDLKGIHAPMRVAPPVRYHWKGDAASVMVPLKRREFSFNTCSGCHKGETNNPFTHVRSRNVGATAELSGFMTGLGADDNADADVDPMGDFWVNDPGPTPEPQRNFNEAKRRAIDLENLVFNSHCRIKPNFPFHLFAIERIIRFRPLNMVH